MAAIMAAGAAFGALRCRCGGCLSCSFSNSFATTLAVLHAGKALTAALSPRCRRLAARLGARVVDSLRHGARAARWGRGGPRRRLAADARAGRAPASGRMRRAGVRARRVRRGGLAVGKDVLRLRREAARARLTIRDARHLMTVLQEQGKALVARGATALAQMEETCALQGLLGSDGLPRAAASAPGVGVGDIAASDAGSLGSVGSPNSGAGMSAARLPGTPESRRNRGNGRPRMTPSFGQGGLDLARNSINLPRPGWAADEPAIDEAQDEVDQEEEEEEEEDDGEDEDEGAADKMARPGSAGGPAVGGPKVAVLGTSCATAAAAAAEGTATA